MQGTQARCQCGQLTAAIDGAAEPVVVLCHCLDCQRRSGSPFGEIAYYPAGAVQFAGEAREYTRTTDAGNRFTGGFCPVCGSTLYTRSSKNPTLTGITIGTIADPAFPPPTRSVYERSRHCWLGLPENVPRHPSGRDS